MRHWKSFSFALVVLAGLATSPASAQQFGVAGFGGNAFGVNQGFGGNGFGVNQGFGGNGFNNFGGGYNNFGGYSNYNRGYNSYPGTYNNMGGLMNSIRTQTGGGNSYRYGYGPATGGRRR